MSVLSVIGGGWSFRAVDHHKIPGELIAVNDSFIYLERRPEVVVSMDRLWTENRWEQINKEKRETWIRTSALKHFNEWRKLEQETDWFHTFLNINTGCAFAEATTSGHVLNGANSGACALNLAYQKRPSELFLFGFDFNIGPDGKAHWYPPYPWAKDGKGAYTTWATDCRMYARQFKQIGTRVINVSMTSAADAFEKISPKQLGCAR